MGFQVEHRGERREGIAEGIDRRHLLRLRRGETPVDFELDLHGLDQRDARRELRTALLEAFEEGARCVLVIHGRGHHSPLGPVLKEKLASWLEPPPLGPRVMAFASARPADGGAGATYVLLRRKRRAGP